MKNLTVMELLFFVLKRHAMFDIYKVEDIYFFILGYCYSHESNENFHSSFQEFIKEKYNDSLFESYSWWRILKFHSNDDISSLNLFRNELQEYVLNVYGKEKLEILLNI